MCCTSACYHHVDQSVIDWKVSESYISEGTLVDAGRRSCSFLGSKTYLHVIYKILGNICSCYRKGNWDDHTKIINIPVGAHKNSHKVYSYWHILSSAFQYWLQDLKGAFGKKLHKEYRLKYGCSWLFAPECPTLPASVCHHLPSSLCTLFTHFFFFSLAFLWTC